MRRLANVAFSSRALLTVSPAQSFFTLKTLDRVYKLYVDIAYENVYPRKSTLNFGSHPDSGSESDLP